MRGTRDTGVSTTCDPKARRHRWLAFAVRGQPRVSNAAALDCRPHHPLSSSNRSQNSHHRNGSIHRLSDRIYHDQSIDSSRMAHGASRTARHGTHHTSTGICGRHIHSDRSLHTTRLATRATNRVAMSRARRASGRERSHASPYPFHGASPQGQAAETAARAGSCGRSRHLSSSSLTA